MGDPGKTFSHFGFALDVDVDSTSPLSLPDMKS